MARRTFVEKLAFDEDALAIWLAGLQDREDATVAARARHLLDYPTVYVVHRPESSDRHAVYVGETTDIRTRTITHLKADITDREDWRQLADADDAVMYVIGHVNFNKSLTLDVEDRLMLWLGGSEAVASLHNRKRNPQNDYYSRDLLDAAFRDAWRELRKHDAVLFPTERIVRESALFKASPFHKLTRQQLEAKARVHDAVRVALDGGGQGRLVLVRGAAGSGKTVLLSSLFYEMLAVDVLEDVVAGRDDLDVRLVVNHDEQWKVYRQIATKLGLESKKRERVTRPTRFINGTSPDTPVDVVLVDEAHLLWTQGKQSYRGSNMLADLLARARVVVAVFDPDQVMATNQYWAPDELAALEAGAAEDIELDQQLRMASSAETLLWVRSLIDRGEVLPLPVDDSYEVRVFDDPAVMYEQIRTRALDESHGLSRITATFDWEFAAGRTPSDGEHWKVTIDAFEIPWNKQIGYASSAKRHQRGLSWAEQPGSIDECGSHFTVQGFDLDYAGVIIGPSVTYRDGRVVFDPSASANRHATQRRTLADGRRESVAEGLLRNELNVLMTRGARGLYLYAVDDELRAALLAAQDRRGEVTP